MKRFLLRVAALSVLLIPCPTLGQLGDVLDDPKETHESTAGDNAEKSQGKSAPDVGRASRQRESQSRRLAAKLAKLQGSLKKQLKLTPSQTKTIDQLFGEYISILREPRRNSTSTESSAKEDAKETTALRAEIRRAEEAGDRVALRQARKALAKKLRAGGQLQADHSIQFIRAVSDELTTEQRPKFQMMVIRLKIGPRRSPRQNPLRGFARIVSSSKLGLTSEQRRDVQLRLRKAFRDIAGAAADPQRVDELFAQARTDIMSQLTPDQQAKLETLLKPGNQSLRRQNLPVESVSTEKAYSEDE